jgi:hypothetical protein
MRSPRTRPFWLRRDNERCQCQPTRNRKGASAGSWVLRSSGCVHLQPLAATCPVRGWVRAFVAEARLSLRSASLQPCAYRLPQHREPSITPLLHADMCEAQEVERPRFPFSTPPPLVDRMRTELQKSRFHRMQFQVELLQEFRKLRPELVGVRFAVKSSHDVISVSHDDDIAVCALLTPRLDQQVK